MMTAKKAPDQIAVGGVLLVNLEFGIQNLKINM